MSSSKHDFNFYKTLSRDKPFHKSHDSTDDINTCPVHDPVQTLIYMATPFNIDTVLIAGEIKKQAGKLVYTDTVLREKLSLLEASGRRILEQAGVSKRAAE